MTMQLLERGALHPSPGDQVFGGEEHGYARFRFFTGEGESWIGAFARIGSSNNTFARSFGPAGDVLVVAQGQGYVVNLPRRALRFTAETPPGDYLFDARALPGNDLIVACSCDCLCAYSSEGEQWVSNDLGGDGIGLGKVTETEVSGWHWLPGDGWYGFRLFINGFRLELEGLLDRDQRAYPDPGVTHPASILPHDSLPPGAPT